MPEIVVLDSHVWYWWINQEHDRYSSDCRNWIEKAERVGISPVSCYELALAHARGRLEFPCAPSEWFAEALQPAGIELLPVTPDISVRAVGLSAIHRDPFDRLIIATALCLDGYLASADGVFQHYPELDGRLI